MKEDDADGDSVSNIGDSALNCTSSSNTPTTQLGRFMMLHVLLVNS